MIVFQNAAIGDLAVHKNFTCSQFSLVTTFFL